MSNSPHPNQLPIDRRKLMLAGAVIATVGVGYSWVVSPSSDGGPRLPRRVQVTSEELLKPGPLPDLVMGKADAPVTIVEYASMTCPACANFHTKVLPVLKEKYIDTGKVRLVFREFPLDTVGMIASMTVRCTGTEKALPLISALFAQQEEWRQPKSLDELNGKLFTLGQQVGLTKEAFNACAPSSDDGKSIKLSPQQQKFVGDIQTAQKRAHESFGVRSTPTFFVNGKRLAHVTVEEFDKAIAPLVK